MTIDEAIKWLEAALIVPDPDVSEDYLEATRLGREALKFRQDWEAEVKEWGFILLPGETKE